MTITKTSTTNRTATLVANADGTFAREVVDVTVTKSVKTYAPNPTKWSDLEDFVEVMGFEDDEYFNLGFEVDGESPIYGADTWRIAVYAVTGGSEGYYVHVDQIAPTSTTERKTCQMLGKFWSSDRALEAVTAITKYVQGWK